MVNQKLLETNRKQLIQLTDAAILKYFNDNAMLAYESEQEEPIFHTRSLISYESAVKTIQIFLHAVLMQDLMVNNLSSAEAVLYLPDTDMKVSVYINEDSPLQPVKQEQVRTSIGVFDEFTWNTIRALEFDKNPVKIFYRRLLDNLTFIRTKLELMEVDWQSVPVNKALLEDCHIQEVVSIHNMLYLLDGAESFVEEG